MIFLAVAILLAGLLYINFLRLGRDEYGNPPIIGRLK